eukprot:COSAG02_NODE_5090_length_4641_cov_4.838397_5_plen_65_part_00
MEASPNPPPQYTPIVSLMCMHACFGCRLQLAKLVFLVVSVFAIGVAAFTDAVPSAPGIPHLNTD